MEHAVHVFLSTALQGTAATDTRWIGSRLCRFYVAQTPSAPFILNLDLKGNRIFNHDENRIILK